MTVLRIVANIESKNVPQVREFYADLLGLEAMMDFGWIVTLGSGESAATQMSIMSEGGSGTPVPELSIEVDNVDEVYARAKAKGCTIIHDLTDEPWGVRRFFMLDPAGKTINILTHK